MRPYEKLLRCYDCFREKIDFQPLIGMTLGSGLGDYADSIDIAATLDYRDIEAFPSPPPRATGAGSSSAMWRGSPSSSCRDASTTMRATTSPTWCSPPA